jgi:hypothetical protein
MSFILKTLGKLLDRHNRDGIVIEKPLHQNQFLYRPGIEGAFDNTSFNAITTAARQHGLGETCCRWVRSMRESRLVRTSLMGSSLTAEVVGGCPQGGVLSPLLWNLVVERLSVATNDLGFNTFGYADNIAIIVQGFAHTVRELVQDALNMVVKWAVKEGLNISPHKTAIVPFTSSRKIEDLGPLTLHGKELKMLGEAKYLGVILDSYLNWNQHLQKTIRKAQTTFAVVRRMYGKKWGLTPNMVHCLYTRVIRPSILHAALVVWWPKVKEKTTKIQLGRIQRMACLAITGAMKSTPTAAMEVLLNLTPLDLLITAEARMALYRLHILKQPTVPKTVSGWLTIWKNVGDPLLDAQSDWKHHIDFKLFSEIQLHGT